MQPSEDPYVPHLGGTVTVIRFDHTTIQGHLWKVRPGYVRLIDADDDMVTIPRHDITDLAEQRYGVGDRIAIDGYDGVHEATIATVLPGAVGVATDDGRTATLNLPPAPGVTVTHLRRATADEVEEIFAGRR